LTRLIFAFVLLADLFGWLDFITEGSIKNVQSRIDKSGTLEITLGLKSQIFFFFWIILKYKEAKN